MPLNIVKGNIVDMEVDAVVSPTNTWLEASGRRSLDAQINAAAGPGLAPALEKIGRCPVGAAVITDGFNMKCRHIIHTVGPVWSGGWSGEELALSSCYTSCLKLAEEAGCSTIAFPLISSGNYSFPPVDALRIARESIVEYLNAGDSDMTVTLVVHDRAEFVTDPETRSSIDDYLCRNYVGNSFTDISVKKRREAAAYSAKRQPDRMPGTAGKERGRKRLIGSAPSPRFRPERREEADSVEYYGGRNTEDFAAYSFENIQDEALFDRPVEDNFPKSFTGSYAPEDECIKTSKAPAAAHMHVPAAAAFAEPAPESLSIEEILLQLDAGFSDTVLKIVDEKNYKASDVYKRANLSKQNWHKMKSTPNYRPDKKTAIALAIGLKLNLSETASLLERAGYILSNSIEGDVIIKYFIEHGNYNIFEINEALYDHDQYVLGCF